MALPLNKHYRLDEFLLEPETCRLTRAGRPVHLANKPFQVLLYLLERRDRLIGHDELLDQFWDGHDVYDDTLRKAVGAIRKAFDDSAEQPRFIETRRAGGYRYIGPLAEEFLPDAPPVANGNRPAPVTAVLTLPAPRRLPQRAWPIVALACAVLALAGLAAFVIRSRTHSLAVAPPPPATSVAVLPLKNLTGDAANDYLSDGITESLINQLSQIKELRVISRGSTFQFKGKDVDAREIGQKLNVETILEGSLKKSGDKLRVEARLVNAKDGSILWASDSQQRKLADIFVIQDGIVCQLVTELKVKLCGEVAPSERYTKNVKAYQLYLQGLYYRNQITNENLQKAVGFYEEALRVEPDYALAHDGLAAVYLVMEFNSAVPSGTAAPKAEFHAKKALEADDSLAGSYAVLGAVKTMKNYDLQTRENYYKQALLKNPNHRTARLWLANNYTVQGKFEEAEREILRVQELDPLSVGVRLHLTELYYYWRKPDKSIAQAELMLAAQPENKGTYSFLAKAYAQKGNFDKAFAALENLPPEDLTRVSVLGFAGRGNEARKIVEDFAKSDEASKTSYWTASLFAAVGDKESAFAWLEKAYALRQADLVSLKIDPAFDSFRDDPRYADLLRRMGLPDSG